MRESHPSVQDLQSKTRLAELWMLQILDTRMGFLSPSLNVVIDYISHSGLKMCKICLKRTLDATFLDCFALTFCDIIVELLPESACLTLQGGTTFLLTSKLADFAVLRVRKPCPIWHMQLSINLNYLLLRCQKVYIWMEQKQQHFPWRHVLVDHYDI